MNTNTPNENPPPPLPERNPSMLLKSSENDTENEVHSRRPSSLQQLQALDLFKAHSDQDSLLLETEQYVRQMEKRRDRLLAKIDHGNGLKVGYEIERRVVRALQTRSMKKKGTKSKKKSRKTSSSKRLSRRRRRKRHRICWKCVTSSFAALFDVITFRKYNRERGYEEDIPPNFDLDVDENRTPTPKMLLMADGQIRWPVYQYGVASGSGMLISTQRMLPKKQEDDEETRKQQPGRENFSLGLKIAKDNKDLEAEERKLLGWLQVRNPKSKTSVFTQVVTPVPEGPFRKIPWQHGNGNLHVFKY
jgi:hypothetical protein